MQQQQAVAASQAAQPVAAECGAPAAAAAEIMPPPPPPPPPPEAPASSSIMLPPELGELGAPDIDALDAELERILGSDSPGGPAIGSMALAQRDAIYATAAATVPRTLSDELTSYDTSTYG